MHLIKQNDRRIFYTKPEERTMLREQVNFQKLSKIQNAKKAGRLNHWKSFTIKPLIDFILSLSRLKVYNFLDLSS